MVDVAKYWDERARQFAETAPHKAAVYIDFLPIAHRMWGFVQRTAVGRHLSISAGDRVLDLGCGTGRWLVELARRGATAFGYDVAEKMREIACESVLGMANAEVIDSLGSIPGGSVDVVLSFNVLHVIDDESVLQSTLAQVGRVLRRGGHFTVIVDQQHDAFVRGRDAATWQKLVEAHGLTLHRRGAGEYSLPLLAYRRAITVARRLLSREKDSYDRSLSLYNRAGWPIRIHELNVAVLMALGLPLEWLLVGRRFCPPLASVLIMTFERA